MAWHPPADVHRPVAAAHTPAPPTPSWQVAVTLPAMPAAHVALQLLPTRVFGPHAKLLVGGATGLPRHTARRQQGDGIKGCAQQLLYLQVRSNPALSVVLAGRTLGPIMQNCTAHVDAPTSTSHMPQMESTLISMGPGSANLFTSRVDAVHIAAESQVYCNKHHTCCTRRACNSPCSIC